MVGGRIQGTQHRDRRARRGAPRLEVVERDGTWHVHGTVRVTAPNGSRRSRRIRKSTGLPAQPDTLAAAETLRDQWAVEFRNQVVHGKQPSCAASIAADKWLNRPRKHGRTAGWREAKLAQAIVLKFGVRLLADIAKEEWTSWAEGQVEGAAPATRERWLNGFYSFINYCRALQREWISDKTIPAFERDQAARKPKHRQRRRVAEWRPELIQLLIDCAGDHLKPQLYAEWTTGQRTSALLHQVRLCDVILAEGREQMTYRRTKTGQPVTASLHPVAAQAIRDYLKIRGKLWDREGPLFLTPHGKPYSDKGFSGQNRTAFNNAKARANAVRRRQALQLALELRRQGRVDDAREAVGQAWADRKLMGMITQHWFRHLLATTLMAMGAPVRVGMDQLGHLTVESYMAYAHDVPEVRRAVVDQLPIGTATKKETA